MDCVDRFKRRSTLQGTTNKERYLNQTKDNFSKYLNSAPNFLTASTRNRSFKIAILNVNDVNQVGDEKYITTEFDSDIVVGDIIVIEDNDILITDTWLVCDRENLVVPSHKKFRISPVNYTLKFVDKNGILYEMPIIKEYKTLYSIGIETDKYTIQGNAKMGITISDTTNSRKLGRDSRVIIDNKAWKITNDEYHGGYLKFMCEEDEFSDYDDLVNGIADKFKNTTIQPHYTFEYPSEVTTQLGTNVSYSFIIKNNGVEVTNPTLQLTLDNSNVVMTNGNLIANALGTCYLTINFTGIDGQVYTNMIMINVVESITSPNYTYQIFSDSGVFETKKYMTNTYSIQKYYNGYPENCAFSISVLDDANKGLIEYEVSSSNSIDITNISGVNGELVTLIFSDLSNGSTITQSISLVV
jgi:hypothetical protein